MVTHQDQLHTRQYDDCLLDDLTMFSSDIHVHCKTQNSASVVALKKTTHKLTSPELYYLALPPLDHWLASMKKLIEKCEINLSLHKRIPTYSGDCLTEVFSKPV